MLWNRYDTITNVRSGQYETEDIITVSIVANRVSSVDQLVVIIMTPYFVVAIFVNAVTV